MATRQKAKTSTAARRKTVKGRGQAPKNDVDKRFSFILFAIGLFVVVLSFVPGESGWAFIRQNILFGAFGISAWFVGFLFIYWAMLIGLEKPVFPAIIKGILFILAICGTALVFSRVDFKGLSFGQIVVALHQSGKSGAFGGGLLSGVFGASLLALTGPLAARILLVFIFAVASMVLTGLGPADIVRLFQRIGDFAASKIYSDDTDENQAGTETVKRQPTQELQKAGQKMQNVDIPLKEEVYRPAPRANKRMFQLDIALEDPKKPSKSTRTNEDLPQNGKMPQQNKSENPNLGLEEDYIPLVPFGPGFPVDIASKEEKKEDILLFGEHDPYANLGGASSKLPRGTFLDAEYLPQDGAPVQLFERADSSILPDAPCAGKLQDDEVFERESDNNIALPTEGNEGNLPEKAAVGSDLPPWQSSQEGQKDKQNAFAPLDAMIEKAATVKNERTATDTRGQAFSFAPYEYPPLAMFDDAPPENVFGVREEMKRTADLLVSTLQSFGVETRILDVSRGPSVTRYEVQPQAGVKISRITNLSDDIALNLAAAGVRIEAPIPGKPAVGIEVPNKVKTSVPIRAILESAAFADATSPLALALGKNIAGEVVVADLCKMPHLLIAGSTGSGKSVCINSIIMSFLFKSSPEEVRLILIDPKVVELAEYNGIPHLLIPVVTEPKQAAKALGYAVNEMEKRYHMFAEHNVRDIGSYNKLAHKTGEVEAIPHIAIVIDELADLMMVAGKDVENFICRIAQKARAAGMHLIVATQRPSVDVITGLIKSNIPSRIAFAVSSQVDSRTILDGVGAEKLLGMGDMLFMPIGANKPVRVQGTFVKDKEISRVLNHVKQNSSAQYDEDVLSEMERVSLTGANKGGTEDENDDNANLLTDETFINAVETAFESGTISTSFLQRRLRLGYARAGRIMDQMERMGIISEPDGSKPRQLLISRQSWQEMQMNASDAARE